MGALRLLSDPPCAFAPVRDPGRTDGPSPVTVPPVLPLLHRKQRLRRDFYIEATAGLKHLLSTLHERLPSPMQDLAGWPLPGGRRTLWADRGRDAGYPAPPAQIRT